MAVAGEGGGGRQGPGAEGRGAQGCVRACVRACVSCLLLFFLGRSIGVRECVRA